MAKYKKKRARELQHDRFRDAAAVVFERLGDRLEGKGKTVLYGLIGLVVAGALIVFFVSWRNRKSEEARRAMGRAITIATTPIQGAISPFAAPPTGPTFSSERERAERAVAEFQKVGDKYGDPYRSQARYFIASNRLALDREQAMKELAELSSSGVSEVATLSRFALGQAKEGDGKLDEAAQLYSELAQQNSAVVTPETANLHLAGVYEKQGKKNEAAELLFNIAEASRKAKDPDGTSPPASAAARAAAQKLEKLDPERYAKLTPAPPPELPF